MSRARVAVTLRGCFIPNYLRGFRVFDMIVFINLSLSAWAPPLRNVFLSKIRIAAFRNTLTSDQKSAIQQFYDSAVCAILDQNVF